MLTGSRPHKKRQYLQETKHRIVEIQGIRYSQTWSAEYVQCYRQGLTSANAMMQFQERKEKQGLQKQNQKPENRSTAMLGYYRA